MVKFLGYFYRKAQLRKTISFSTKYIIEFAFFYDPPHSPGLSGSQNVTFLFEMKINVCAKHSQRTISDDSKIPLTQIYFDSKRSRPVTTEITPSIDPNLVISTQNSNWSSFITSGILGQVGPASSDDRIILSLASIISSIKKSCKSPPLPNKFPLKPDTRSRPCWAFLLGNKT